MSIQDLPSWDPIHTSVYRQARSLSHPAETKASPGAFRYRCPITGSYVLVTDEATLQWLARPSARLRCANCGELHLFSAAADDGA